MEPSAGGWGSSNGPLPGHPALLARATIGGSFSIGGLPLSWEEQFDALVQIPIQAFSNYGRLQDSNYPTHAAGDLKHATDH